jgi:protein CpxP
MKRTHTLIAGVVTGVALAVAAATYAQPSGNAGPGHEFHAKADPAVRVESRLTDLKAQLKITAAQETAWQAYTAQVKQQAASRHAAHAQMQEGTGSAPDRMAQRTAAMKQQAAGMEATTRAFSVLYGALTPEQKAIADQNVAMPGHHGKHFGHHAG